MDNVVLVSYFVSLFILFVFGLHGFIMIFYYNKYKNVKYSPKNDVTPDYKVTIQLPLFNELYVVERIINAVCEIDYPKENWRFRY